MVAQSAVQLDVIVCARYLAMDFADIIMCAMLCVEYAAVSNSSEQHAVQRIGRWFEVEACACALLRVVRGDSAGISHDLKRITESLLRTRTMA